MSTVDATRYGNGAFGPYVITSAISANVDDFTCVGWDDSLEVRLVSKSAVVITGFFAVPGRRTLCRVIINAGTYPIALTSQGSASLDVNKIVGSGVVLPPDGVATIAYDYTALRWRILSHTGTVYAAGLVRTGCHWFTDFVTGTAAVPELTYASGAGGSTSQAALVGALGVYSALTDNATAGSWVSVQSTMPIRFSQYAPRIVVRAQLLQLAPVGDPVAYRLGFIDTDNAKPVDGAYIEYDSSVSANWRYCTANNSTRSEVASAVPVTAGAWHLIEVAVNAAGTIADFFVNGSSIGQLATNIPTSLIRTTRFGFHVVRLAGTPAQFHQLAVDSLGLDADFSPSR